MSGIPGSAARVRKALPERSVSDSQLFCAQASEILICRIARIGALCDVTCLVPGGLFDWQPGSRPRMTTVR
jgi:hypothetical protein